MNINKFDKHWMITVLLGFFILLSMISCQYEVNYKESTEYPDQLIYMPAAIAGSNGQFVINTIAKEIGSLPFPGYPYRYVVDASQRKFIVPLSAYRAGVNNKGGFIVNIKANTDIIEKINADLTDKMLLIPSDKYSLVNSVEMKDGQEYALFDLMIDLDFLRDNFPGKIFAMGVEISSAQRERNEALCVTAVIIHTNLMKPTANFTSAIDDLNKRRVMFTNSSLMSEKYQWSFGDSSGSDETSPSHVYSNAGTYTVTLTAVGITGDQDKSIKSVIVTIE